MIRGVPAFIHKLFLLFQVIPGAGVAMREPLKVILKPGFAFFMECCQLSDGRHEDFESQLWDETSEEKT